jgi:hypothetical protein
MIDGYIDLYHRFPSLFVIENWIRKKVIIRSGAEEQAYPEITNKDFLSRFIYVTELEWKQHLKDINACELADYGITRLTHIPTGDCVELWYRSLGTHYEKDRDLYVCEHDEHIILWPKALHFLYGEDLVNMQNWFKCLANIAPTNQSEYNSTNIPNELRAQERYK